MKLRINECLIIKIQKWKGLGVKCILTIKLMKKTVWTPYNMKDSNGKMMMTLSSDTQINNLLILSIITLMNIEKLNLKIWRLSLSNKAIQKLKVSLWFKTMFTTQEKINKNQINSIILNKEELLSHLKPLKVVSIKSNHIVSMKTFLKPLRN